MFKSIKNLSEIYFIHLQNITPRNIDEISVCAAVWSGFLDSCHVHRMLALLWMPRKRQTSKYKQTQLQNNLRGINVS